jgi:hypothetical protein
MDKKPRRLREKPTSDVVLKQKVQSAQLRQDLRQTFSSTHGKRALRFLLEICGFHNVSIVGNPQTGDVHDRGTLYNEARRNVYLELRAYLSNEILRDVEFYQSEITEIDDL